MKLIDPINVCMTSLTGPIRVAEVSELSNINVLRATNSCVHGLLAQWHHLVSLGEGSSEFN
jgi:hypothetical protein